MRVLQNKGTEDIEPVSLQTIRKIAAEEGVEPTELPPLHDTIETDALDALFASAEHASGRVEFTYSGYNVSIDGENHIHVEPV